MWDEMGSPGSPFKAKIYAFGIAVQPYFLQCGCKGVVVV